MTATTDERRAESPADASAVARTQVTKRHVNVWLSIVQLLWVLVFYVASAGPLYWRIFEAYHLGGSSLLAKFYLPLTLACQYCPPFAAFMDWYVGLWVL